MTEQEHNDDTSATDEDTVCPNTARNDSLRSSRRHLLETLTGGGSILLAGCEMIDSGDSRTSPASPDAQSTATISTGTNDLSQVQGQTFRATTEHDPAKTTFYRDDPTLQDTAYAVVAKEPASPDLRRFLRPPGMWINYPNSLQPDGDLQYTWIDKPIEVTPTEITLTIQDDATWSDGHPISGRDLALSPLEWTLRKRLVPAYAPTSQTPNELSRAGDFVLASFDDFQIGEKSVTYRSSDGYFGNFWKQILVYWTASILFPLSPTHIAPFDTYADDVIETARRAQAGEIYPWYRPSKGLTGDPNRKSLIEEHLTQPKYVRKFSKPSNVLSTGVWELVEFDGKDFVFEPNPHHPSAESINFETLRLGYSPSIKRERVALNANRLDYASPGITPQTVIDGLPDNIKYLRVPGGGGNVLKMNFDHPAMGIREVRLAIMYALDKKAIAKNIHQSATVPITTPGGDTWDATDYVSQKWIEQNLTTYTQDREQAASLMVEAGYAKDRGQWINEDGESLTLTLPTTSSQPKWEQTVASQLKEFGINTQIRTLPESVLEDRLDNGEFAIWANEPHGLRSRVANKLLIFLVAAKQSEQFGIFPEAQYGTGQFNEDGTPIPQTEDRYRVFTIQAPPVGQPDGPLKEYHPAALGLFVHTNPPKEELRRRGKIGMWLANWFLPTIPINKRYIQHFIDDAHWLWPTGTTSWRSFINGDDRFRRSQALLGTMELQANPANPEEGSYVGEE